MFTGERVLLGVEEDLVQRLVAKHLVQYHARVDRHVLVVVPGASGQLFYYENLMPRYEPHERRKDDLVLGGDILNGWPSRTDLSTQQDVENLGHALARPEVEAPNMGDEVQQQTRAVRRLRELRDEVGHRIPGSSN